MLKYFYLFIFKFINYYDLQQLFLINQHKKHLQLRHYLDIKCLLSKRRVNSIYKNLMAKDFQLLIQNLIM